MDKPIVLKVRNYQKDRALAVGSWLPRNWEYVAVEVLPNKMLNKDIANKLKDEEYLIVLIRRVNKFVIPKTIQ